MAFCLNEKTVLWVEPEAFPGVRQIADTLALDIAAVIGSTPKISPSQRAGTCVLCATAGHSPAAEALTRRGILDASLSEKREVYQLALTEWEGYPLLVICGSDKRGTIYGMFALSEYIGVTPMCFFGDAEPMQRKEIAIGEDIQIISREPSVKYRGFFINDEWPCFGTWATRRYGGINAKCYKTVFEFLLRLKGNYLWPAMWASNFALDGPGSANEELADMYGVIIGYSHHEPCLRSGEEWDLVRGEGTRYGNEWSFETNRRGLLNYWEDSLKRSGGYENIITIGMRGERDTAMLGEGSAVGRNIALLKQIITCQRELIAGYVHRPAVQLLALYKEVEAYFYGTPHTPGLKDWPELRDVLFLLCEDNFGHLRALPPKELAEHPGGWGMYYHFDYHGAPISYEWVDSTPMSQTWEAMTQAWEWGIRELWIVNVGDIKFHETALAYFMAMAYDFDTWGSGNPDSPEAFRALWTRQTFPQATPETQQEIANVLRDYVNLNSLRRPEALHPGIYHPCHYHETERMLSFVRSLEERSQAVYTALCPRERAAYYSMIHFPAMVSANLCKLHLYAGKNHHYAAQGKPVANHYISLARVCMELDTAHAEQFAAFRDGKWAGMELAAHIGFTKWNEDDSRYPVLCQVTPMKKPCMKVSRSDLETVATKNYGTPMEIPVPFQIPGLTRVSVEIANGGTGSLHYTISPEAGAEIPVWLCADSWEGTVEEQETIILACDPQRLEADAAACRLLVSDGDTVVALKVTVLRYNLSALPPLTFLPREGVISILAEHFCGRRDANGGAYHKIKEYGKFGSGMKVAPSTAAFQGTEGPELTYRVFLPEPGVYRLTLYTAPNNPVEMGAGVTIGLTAGGRFQTVSLISPAFRAGEYSDSTWSEGVLNQVHTATLSLTLPAGAQELTLTAQSPGVVLEALTLSRTAPYSSYLSPPESPHT